MAKDRAKPSYKGTIAHINVGPEIMEVIKRKADENFRSVAAEIRKTLTKVYGERPA